LKRLPVRIKFDAVGLRTATCTQ